MKILKSILSLILVLSLVSCKETSDRKPNATGTSYATLIAYSIHGKHKRSDATLQLNQIGSGDRFAVKGNVYHGGEPRWSNFTDYFVCPIQRERDNKLTEIGV